MKKIIYISLAFIFISCGFIPMGHLGHSTNTQVVLSEANYKVINSVQGKATASFILGIGPLFNDRLYSQAKLDMMRNANLSGGGNKSRALINITSDVQYKYFWYVFPFYISKTIYISADIIEFKE